MSFRYTLLSCYPATLASFGAWFVQARVTAKCKFEIPQLRCAVFSSIKATDGSQPLHVAAAAGHVELAELLSPCGDLRICCPFCGGISVV